MMPAETYQMSTLLLLRQPWQSEKKDLFPLAEPGKNFSPSPRPAHAWETALLPRGLALHLSSFLPFSLSRVRTAFRVWVCFYIVHTFQAIKMTLKRVHACLGLGPGLCWPAHCPRVPLMCSRLARSPGRPGSFQPSGKQPGLFPPGEHRRGPFCRRFHVVIIQSASRDRAGVLSKDIKTSR